MKTQSLVWLPVLRGWATLVEVHTAWSLDDIVEARLMAIAQDEMVPRPKEEPNG